MTREEASKVKIGDTVTIRDGNQPATVKDIRSQEETRGEMFYFAVKLVNCLESPRQLVKHTELKSTKGVRRTNAKAKAMSEIGMVRRSGRYE